ncbi:MAG: proline--tRNA ligase [Candidatus Algichlamydia australiensis]|nr:proline--tRNA ligase [Chlamydiales bacterium]
MKHAINPTRDQDFPEWYQQVVKAADLAESSSVRGCMVIKPWGYGIWEKMQRDLDQKFKQTGVSNAYFPLFIPLSYLEKEAEHVEGFAKECAVVTHHRLKKDPDGGLIPDGELEEPLIVRPTSETIIGASFAKWIESYRDMPLLINQWANVVRWEMRPRILLRTAEFLWQEGHTAHATKEEAVAKAKEMHAIYQQFSEESLAIPVIVGKKSEGERFPGALTTYTLEAMMQDRKALQGCTSHFLGQNFSKASGIKFRNEKGEEDLAWTTSWGSTTRFIGALVMVHSDDDGLRLPPRMAPSQVVIIPVIHKEEARTKVMNCVQKVKEQLSTIDYHGEKISVIIDDREMRGGEKSWSWIKKGIPMRIEIGPRDIDEGKLCIRKRTSGHKDMEKQSPDELASTIISQLDEMQKTLYAEAQKFMQENMHEIDTKEEFDAFFTKGKGGFALTPFAGDVAMEKEIQKRLSVTVRCIPENLGEGVCPFTGKNAKRVVFAKSY